MQKILSFSGIENFTKDNTPNKESIIKGTQIQ
jgi:hypothetical protein